MKNILIVAVVAIIAFMAYQYINVTPVESAPNTELSTPPSLSSSAHAKAAVFILEPGNGSTVSSPVSIKFGVSNMTIAPAGDNQPMSGHHHLLINVDSLPDLTQPLPASDNLIHFGKGQTETVIDLEPGTHTLQLLLGNYLHVPHNTPVLSKKISITVQ